MAASSSLFTADEDDCFFFESDHLALRGNKDYCEVLKTLVILSAQREKLVKDYNKVVEIKTNVLKDSDDVLQKLKNGEDLGIELPPLIELPKLPVINFEKYNVKFPETELSSIYSNTSHNKIEEELKKEQERNKNDNYQVWSTEEQKKLEELLQKYPPEAIERRRFQKIAKELGNRSVSQVASRIQKYFLKLYKAGLPVPGRIPKCYEKNKKSFLHKHQRYNHYLWKPTTFFPTFSTPVTMQDSDNIPGPSGESRNLPLPSNSENYLMETNYKQTSEITDKSKAELQLQLLKRVKEEKLKETENDGAFTHIGFKCDYCNCEPITGTRWHCAVCPDSIDFCNDCIVSQLYTSKSHPITHPFVIYRNDEHHSVSSQERLSKIVKEEGESSDSYGFEDTEKEEIEGSSDSDEDEESRSNFDSDMN